MCTCLVNVYIYMPAEKCETTKMELWPESVNSAYVCCIHVQFMPWMVGTGKTMLLKLKIFHHQMRRLLNVLRSTCVTWCTNCRNWHLTLQWSRSVRQGTDDIRMDHVIASLQSNNASSPTPPPVYSGVHLKGNQNRKLRKCAKIFICMLCFLYFIVPCG